MDTEPPETLTATQVAKRYNIPMATLRNMRFRHEGPPYYSPTPRLTLYRVSEIEDWLDSIQNNPQQTHNQLGAADDQDSNPRATHRT